MSRFLSYVGRLQLLKVVLYGMQSYWSSHLFLQKGVLKKLMSLFTKFLWGGSTTSSKQAKVSWDDCCFPKDENGLGLKNLFDRNKAAIYYNFWRILTPNSSSIWVSWVREIMEKNKGTWNLNIPYYASWCLKKKLKARDEVLRYVDYAVSRNSTFLLWHDPWLNKHLLIAGTTLLYSH